MVDIIIDDKNKDGLKTASTTIVVVESDDEKFKPKGAIAFFVVLMLICAVIWYSVYYIQLTRQ